MTRQCPDDGLPDLAQGRLPADVARELAAHAAGCKTCGDELAWLRAEAKLFADRAAAAPTPPDHVWKAIQARTSDATVEKQQRRRKRLLVAGATFAAAAAVILAVGVVGSAKRRSVATIGIDAGTVAMVSDAAVDSELPGLSVPGRASKGSVALDDADRQLDEAIAELTKEYQRRRATLPPARARRYDAEFEAARAAVDDARRSAGPNVSARRQVVRARSHYLRSMQTVVLKEAEHATR
jgi:hypothetical protein